LFIFILLANNIDLIPYSFTTISQIILTLILSSTIMISVTFIRIMKHGIRFINLFLILVLKLAVSCIQAYVLTILTATYIKDSILLY
jgi:F0F1-type ATP synthase membrane subunit a